jgi:hypothetical protein
LPEPRRLAAAWRTAFGAVLLVLVALLSAGCSDGERPTPVPTATPAGATASPAARDAGAPFIGSREYPAEQAGELQRIFEQTSAIRGLEPLAPLQFRLIDRARAVEFVRSVLLPEEERAYALKGDIYKLLGLIPESADLLDLSLRPFGEPIILGFYDPVTKAAFIYEDQGALSALSRATLAHEFVHALQDQHYDLLAGSLQRLGNLDATMAYAALLEGDARSVDTAYMRRHFTAADLAEFVRAASAIPGPDPAVYPAVLIRELFFPYDAGASFLSAVTARVPGGLEGVFRDPPDTTEQILHPSAYLEGEGPKPVDLPDLSATLGAGWQARGETRLGEFGLQNFLRLGLSSDATVSAAAGWGGDAFRLYDGPGGARLLQGGIVWDTRTDAAEFWSAVAPSLRARGGKLATPSPTRLVWEGGGQRLYASLDGDTVSLVLSDRPDAADLAARWLGIG